MTQEVMRHGVSSRVADVEEIGVALVITYITVMSNNTQPED